MSILLMFEDIGFTKKNITETTCICSPPVGMHACLSEPSPHP